MTNVEPHNNSHANQNPNIIHDDEYINQIEVKLINNSPIASISVEYVGIQENVNKIYSVFKSFSFKEPVDFATLTRLCLASTTFEYCSPPVFITKFSMISSVSNNVRKPA